MYEWNHFVHKKYIMVYIKWINCVEVTTNLEISRPIKMIDSEVRSLR